MIDTAAQQRGSLGGQGCLRLNRTKSAEQQQQRGELRRHRNRSEIEYPECHLWWAKRGTPFVKKFAKWLDSGGMGGMEATQGDRTDRQTGRGEERKDSLVRSGAWEVAGGGEMKTYFRGRHCSHAVSGSIDLHFGLHANPREPSSHCTVPGSAELLLCPLPELGITAQAHGWRVETNDNGCWSKYCLGVCYPISSWDS